MVGLTWEIQPFFLFGPAVVCALQRSFGGSRSHPMVLLSICTGFMRSFLECFEVSLARNRDCQAMLEEMLLLPPLGNRGSFLWLASFFATLSEIGWRETIYLLGVEASRECVWELIRFNTLPCGD